MKQIGQFVVSFGMTIVVILLLGWLAGCAPPGSPVGTGFEGLEQGPPDGTVQDIRIFYSRWDKTNEHCQTVRQDDRTDVLGCAAFYPTGDKIALDDGTSWDCLVWAPNERIALHEAAHCISREEGHAGFYPAEHTYVGE